MSDLDVRTARGRPGQIEGREERVTVDEVNVRGVTRDAPRNQPDLAGMTEAGTGDSRRHRAQLRTARRLKRANFKLHGPARNE